MRFVLGIDVSTTASKALVADEEGRIVGVASTPHGHSSPNPLWSEQEPAEWWQAASCSIRHVLDQSDVAPEAIAAVGLTGQMHGLVLLGANGRVLRPAMLWNDGRSSAQCEAMRTRLGLDRLVAITGNDAFTGFTAPKLLWVRDHEPEVYAQAEQVLLPKDYVRYRLTGEFATDKAGAGGTLLLDLTSRDWSDAVLDAMDIPRQWLPPTFEGSAVTGRITQAAAIETGLRAGTPVMAGGGDQAAQAVGVGAVSPAIWALTLGTSGVVFAPCATPRIAPQGRAHAFPHAVPGQWHMMGVMLSAAGSLRWYHDALAADMTYEDLLEEAAQVPIGCDGLFFLPYLTGERTPHADPLAQGAFVGLRPRHTRGHLTRAVLEGVAFGLKDNFLLLQDSGLSRPRELRISGGGAQSPLWCQILSDVLEVELWSMQTQEGASFGAVLCAGVGAELWPTVEGACQQTIQTLPAARPDAAASAQYAAVHARFRSLYPSLSPFFGASV